MAEQASNSNLKGLSIGSMVCGIVGLVFFWSGWFGFPAGVVGLILGIVALSKSKGTKYDGRGMAIAGVVCGGVAALFSLLIIIFAIILVGAATSAINSWY
jgi:hypothetical protein